MDFFNVIIIQVALVLFTFIFMGFSFILEVAQKVDRNFLRELNDPYSDKAQYIADSIDRKEKIFYVSIITSIVFALASCCLSIFIIVSH